MMEFLFLILLILLFAFLDNDIIIKDKQKNKEYNITEKIKSLLNRVKGKIKDSENKNIERK